jgi:hypothetical protein
LVFLFIIPRLAAHSPARKNGGSNGSQFEFRSGRPSCKASHFEKPTGDQRASNFQHTKPIPNKNKSFPTSNRSQSRSSNLCQDRLLQESSCLIHSAVRTTMLSIINLKSENKMQDTRHNLNYSYTVKDDAYARPSWSRPEPDSLQDVTISVFGIDGLSHGSSSSHQAGNCLPTADELRRLERPRPRRAMPWAKWAVSMVVAFACLLWIVIGVSRRHDDGGRGSSSASTNNEDNNAKTLTGVGDNAGVAASFDRSASDVIAYLVQNKISSKESLQDSTSAQSKAVQWLVNNDGNPWTLPTVPLTQRDGYVFASRYVLVRYDGSTCMLRGICIAMYWLTDTIQTFARRRCCILHSAEKLGNMILPFSPTMIFANGVRSPWTLILELFLPQLALLAIDSTCFPQASTCQTTGWRVVYRPKLVSSSLCESLTWNKIRFVEASRHSFVRWINCIA